MTRRRNLALVMAALLALSLVAAGGLAGCKKKTLPPKPAKPDVVERPVEEPAPLVYWPLTGAVAGAESAIDRRPLSIKVENSKEARPQIGLQEADVVYESIAEGGVTRFNAIFHSTLPAEVGPVRSARLSDVSVVPQYNALFAFSGASTEVNSAVRAAGLPNLSQDAGVSAPYRRSSQRYAPHNLYIDVAKAYAEATQRGYEVTSVVAPLAFDQSVRAIGTPNASTVTVPFSNYNTVTWNFDVASKRYLRVNNGTPFVDAGTGAQISAKNVVVLWAAYVPASTNKGAQTFDINLVGTGTASMFIDGVRIDGAWTAGASAPPTFTSADGTPLLLAPGNTWFQVVPLGTVVSAG